MKKENMRMYLLGKYESVKTEYLYAKSTFGFDSAYTNQKKGEYLMIRTICEEMKIEIH